VPRHNQPANAEHCLTERILILMYATDLVLLSHDPRELAVMLVVVMDQVTREYGMTINAAKTEIQVQQPAKP
jgi:hypothetical protein